MISDGIQGEDVYFEPFTEVQFTHLLCFAKGKNVPRVGVQRKDESGTRDEVVDLGSTIPDVLERGEKPKGLRKGACCSPWHVLVFFFCWSRFFEAKQIGLGHRIPSSLIPGTKNHHLNIKHRYPFPAIQKNKSRRKVSNQVYHFPRNRILSYHC